MKLSLLPLLVTIVITCSSFAEEPPKTSEPLNSSFTGQWYSFELGGRDIGNNLKSIAYTFFPEGRFSVLAVMSDGKQATYSGQYIVHETTLELKISDKGTEKMPYTLQNGILMIRDPKLDSYVKFRQAHE